jgi:acetyl-CoA/propionyl-CoA carboxylase carboxyl transferase subunit
VTGEDVDMESLGGPDVHSRQSGVAHYRASDEDSALREARRVTDLLANQGRFDLSALGSSPALGDLLPANRKRAYDVHPLILGILDEASFFEFHGQWAPNVVTGLGRLAGRTVGVVANNPLRLGGCLNSASAEKAARFVRMCDALGVPLVVIVDVPGYLPGAGQETDGVVRRGAKLLHAFGEARVPRVTVVTRKAFGGAYIAMNSRALGANAVFAWSSAEVAVMGASAAVEILNRRELAAASAAEREPLLAKLIAQQEQESGGLARAVSIGVVDEVIEPDTTRARLAAALAAIPPARGAHGNIPL